MACGTSSIRGSGGEPLANAILRVRNLKTNFYTYAGVVKALDGVDFDLAEGETRGLVGETGCGKSVTALSLLRLIPQPPGKIEEGEALFDVPPDAVARIEALEAQVRKALPRVFGEREAANPPDLSARRLRTLWTAAQKAAPKGSADLEALRAGSAALIKVKEKYDLFLKSDAEMRAIRGNKIAMIFQEPMQALNPVFPIGDQISENIVLHQRPAVVKALVDKMELEAASVEGPARGGGSRAGPRLGPAATAVGGPLRPPLVRPLWSHPRALRARPAGPARPPVPGDVRRPRGGLRPRGPRDPGRRGALPDGSPRPDAGHRGRHARNPLPPHPARLLVRARAPLLPAVRVPGRRRDCVLPHAPRGGGQLHQARGGPGGRPPQGRGGREPAHRRPGRRGRLSDPGGGAGGPDGGGRPRDRAGEPPPRRGRGDHGPPAPGPPPQVPDGFLPPAAGLAEGLPRPDPPAVAHRTAAGHAPPPGGGPPLGGRDAAEGEDLGPRPDRGPVPVRAQRRDAAARAHRDRAVVQPPAADRGRADDRARRHDPGPDPGAHPRAQDDVRLDGPDHHPRPRDHRGDVQPGVRDVRGADRGRRPCPHGLQGPAPPVHAGADEGGPLPHGPQGGARDHPRVRAEHDPPAN